MDTDEKNKFSTNINEYDKDFRHTDKYDQAGQDRLIQKGHKRTTETEPEVDIRKGIHHDPYNTSHKERKNHKLNEPLEMEHSNIKREESPTVRDMHHVFIPDAKIKQPKEHHKVSKEKWAEVPGGKDVLIKHEQKNTEVIHSKQTQFPGRTNAFSHGHGNKTS